jgi:hypothetical protein
MPAASRAALALAIVATSACGEGAGDESQADEMVASVDEGIRDPTPAAADFLLAAVKVHTWRGVCSGTLIATDRVLTAAHCFCTENLVGGNVCDSAARVVFRDNPATGQETPDIDGTGTHHPSYNPSWWDAEIENDIAVVALDSDAPAYITPIPVANSKPLVGSNVMVAGYGLTGSSCGGDAGTLNFDIARIDRFVDNGRIMQFDDPVICDGDSGGPVLNTAGTLLFGVHSDVPPTIAQGWVSKSIMTQPYYEWIRSLTCSSGTSDRCDRKASMCRCSAGLGDCDVDADCATGLRCAQNVGATFGFPPTIDVCVPQGGPMQGTCTCKNSGLANICTEDENNCSAGFAPVCSPQTGSGGATCGGCSCQ